MRTARPTALAGVMALALATATLPATAQSIPKLATPVTVKVGTVGALSHAGIYVANARGYFKESNITTEMVVVATIDQMTAPLATGQLDLGTLASGAGFFNAIARDVKLRVVADQNTQFPGRAQFALLVRRDLIESGKFKGYPDLKGLTFGLGSPRAVLELNMLKIIKEGGLNAADVKTVIIPFTNINAAFGGKTVDAAFQIEPFTTAAVGAGLAVRFKGLDEITPYDSAGFLVMSEAFAARTEVAQAWMVAYLRGIRDYMDAVDKGGRAKEDIIKILIDNTRIKDRAVYDKMVMPAFHPNGDIDPESIRRAYREYRRLGYVTVELDPDRVYDTSFIRYATKVLGPYPHRHPY
jgi:NitT/TauT family transport system substrate-binding protein